MELDGLRLLQTGNGDQLHGLGQRHIGTGSQAGGVFLHGQGVDALAHIGQVFLRGGLLLCQPLGDTLRLLAAGIGARICKLGSLLVLPGEFFAHGQLLQALLQHFALFGPQALERCAQQLLQPNAQLVCFADLGTGGKLLLLGGQLLMQTGQERFVGRLQGLLGCHRTLRGARLLEQYRLLLRQCVRVFLAHQSTHLVQADDLLHVLGVAVWHARELESQRIGGFLVALLLCQLRAHGG